MNTFEALSKLSESKRKPPCRIYLDEETNQIKEVPLSNMDSAGSAYMKKKINEARLIHDSIFGKY